MIPAERLYSGDNNVSKNVEKPDWTPYVSIRPHHLLYQSVIQKAISGKEISNKVILRYLLSKRGREDPSGYHEDVFGTKWSDIAVRMRSEKTFYDLLRDLSDEAVVQLDLKPDGLCRACRIGRHCTGTNFEGPNQTADSTAQGEYRALVQIRSSLERGGYREGKDFVFKLTPYVLFDFGGKNLKENSSPQPLNVNFNSMLVKMGALRGIILRVGIF
jgi:hypothetical protein